MTPRPRTPPGPRGPRRGTTRARPLRPSGVRTAPPSAAAATYTKALVAWDRRTTGLLLRALGPLAPSRTDAAADGAAGAEVSAAEAAAASRRVNEVLRAMLLSLGDPSEVLDVVGGRVEAHSEAQWKAQLAALGVKLEDLPGVDVRALRAGWRERNLALIKSLAAEKVARVKRLLEESPGSRVETLAKRIGEETGASRRRAELLARDQTLKLNAQVAQARHQAAGVTEYVWRTSRDERVRSRHKALEGTRQSYAEPPVVDPRTGRRAHPGDDYQCRCTADPLLPGLEDLDGFAPAGTEAPEPPDAMIGDPGDPGFTALEVTPQVAAMARRATRTGVARAGILHVLKAGPEPVAAAVAVADFETSPLIRRVVENDPTLSAHIDRVGGLRWPRASGGSLVGVNLKWAAQRARTGAALGNVNTDTVASLGKTTERVVERVIVHESSHHLYRELLRLSKDPAEPAARRAEAQAILEANEAAFDRASANRAHSPSTRSLDDKVEYFCEAHTAHVFHTRQYRKLDPAGTAAIERMRRFFGCPPIPTKRR